MELNLYYNPKEQVYYYYNDDKTCDNCFKPFVDVVLVKVVWDRLGSGVQYFCKRCKDKFQENNKATYIERFVGVLTNNISRNCEIVLISKPTLTDSTNVLIFDIDKLQDGKTVDKTNLANRESWEGSSVGSLDYQDEGELTGLAFIEEQKYINPINDDELDKLLLSHKNSIPVIEYEKKQKLLDNGNGSL